MLKRIFDIIGALILIVVTAPIMIGIALWMIFKRDLPILYISERMKTVNQPFNLYKFRTMRPPRPDEQNAGATGGHKQNRVTPLGRILRKSRLDEIPQLFNILKGDMSFVGPRPPLRRYTESHRKIYKKVLKTKPGITGLASMLYHQHEEFLLKGSQTPEENEKIYTERCIPWKAKIDLIYTKRQNIFFDLWILYQTLAKILPWLPYGRFKKR